MASFTEKDKVILMASFTEKDKLFKAEMGNSLVSKEIPKRSPVNEEVHAALTALLKTDPKNTRCFKCHNYISVRCQEALEDGILVGHWYRVICEQCGEVGPENRSLSQCIKLWIAKHRLLRKAGKKGGRNV